MPQSLFHAGEHRFVITGFDIDHAVGRQACLRDGRCKKICALKTP